MNSILIELDNRDALAFREFMKYRDTFDTLQNAGVFNIRNGSALLAFDSTGTLNEVELSIKNYKKGKPVIHRIIPIPS